MQLTFSLLQRAQRALAVGDYVRVNRLSEMIEAASRVESDVAHHHDDNEDPAWKAIVREAQKDVASLNGESGGGVRILSIRDAIDWVCDVYRGEVSSVGTGPTHTVGEVVLVEDIAEGGVGRIIGYVPMDVAANARAFHRISEKLLAHSHKQKHPRRPRFHLSADSDSLPDRKVTFSLSGQGVVARFTLLNRPFFILDCHITSAENGTALRMHRHVVRWLGVLCKSELNADSVEELEAELLRFVPEYKRLGVEQADSIIQEISREGALSATRALVRRGVGFDQLAQLRRLDLSFEHLVVSYDKLFHKDEVQEASTRLKARGFVG